MSKCKKTSSDCGLVHNPCIAEVIRLVLECVCDGGVVLCRRSWYVFQLVCVSFPILETVAYTSCRKRSTKKETICAVVGFMREQWLTVTDFCADGWDSGVKECLATFKFPWKLQPQEEAQFLDNDGNNYIGSDTGNWLAKAYEQLQQKQESNEVCEMDEWVPFHLIMIAHVNIASFASMMMRFINTENDVFAAVDAVDKKIYEVECYRNSIPDAKDHVLFLINNVCKFMRGCQRFLVVPVWMHAVRLLIDCPLLRKWTSVFLKELQNRQVNHQVVSYNYPRVKMELNTCEYSNQPGVEETRNPFMRTTRSDDKLLKC